MLCQVIDMSHTQLIAASVPMYTVSHNKGAKFFLCNFVKNQCILMQLSLLELQTNDTCDIMNFSHLT